MVYGGYATKGIVNLYQLAHLHEAIITIDHQTYRFQIMNPPTLIAIRLYADTLVLEFKDRDGHVMYVSFSCNYQRGMRCPVCD